MKELDLRRIIGDQRGIIGELKLPDRDLYTLERPWVDNIPNISCIPAGSYICKIGKTGKHGLTYMVQYVPGRTAILIHKGNFIRNTEGCIIIGLTYYNKPGEELRVNNSRIAHKQFMEYWHGTPRFRLNIYDNGQ